MTAKRLYPVLHWTARILAVLVAGFFFLFFFGEVLGPRHGSYPTPFEMLSIGTLLGSSVAMLLAWFWEKWAGLATFVLGVAFLCELFVLKGLHAAKPAAWALFLLWPIVGLVYLSAARLRCRPQAGAL